jgi:2-methylfumaryl-CoA hydratase
VPGEKIDHVDGMTVEDAEQQIATRLYQNTAKVHFNNFAQKSIASASGSSTAAT